MIPWILVSVIIALILFVLLIIFLIKNKGKEHKPDYYSLFVMGAIWIPFGIFFMINETGSSIGEIFFLLGWIYFVIGIMNKEKWQKNRNVIKNQKLRWILSIALGLLVLLGLVAYFFMR